MKDGKIDDDEVTQEKNIRIIDPDRLCSFSEVFDNKIIHCGKLADYRIIKQSGREYRTDAGKWVKQLVSDYMCSKHFDVRYRYNDLDSPADGSWTFRKIIRVKAR
jgi:hypothetical protein